MTRFRFASLAQALFDLRTNPPLSLLITFVCGILIMSVLGNFAYDFAKSSGNPDGMACVNVGLEVVVFVVIAAISYSRYTWKLENPGQVSQYSDAAKAKIVITALSPYNFNDDKPNLQNVTRLIRYHTPMLRRIYLVATLDRTAHQDHSRQGVAKSYESLLQWMATEQITPRPDIRVIKVSDQNNDKETFEKASLFMELHLQRRVNPDQIAIDVTAGTKAMSVGLAGVALVYDCVLSYQFAHRNEMGNLTSSEAQVSVLNSKLILQHVLGKHSLASEPGHRQSIQQA